MSNKEKKNTLICGSNSLPRNASFQFPDIQHSEPLWKRAPTRDNSGKPYADFMMIIPGLKNFEATRLNDIINKMGGVLKHYENEIIMADLNLKINVLWVTLEPHIGLSTEIAALIHHVVPEAKLVSQHSATGS